MRKLGQPAVILGLLLTMLVGATAAGDDMVALRISNDGTDPVLVTIYDMNAQPPGAVVVRQTINGFAWIPVSVTADARERDIYGGPQPAPRPARADADTTATTGWGMTIPCRYTRIPRASHEQVDRRRGHPDPPASPGITGIFRLRFRH